MQIVIDIPRNVYKHIKDFDIQGDDSYTVIKAVFDGTPLPKNHGDLIDRNELLDCSYEIDAAYTYDEVVHIDDVRQAPTIIEAEVSADD